MSKAILFRILLIVALTAFIVPQKFMAGEQADGAIAAKKAGVKRVGVFTGGTQGDSVSTEVLGLLQGDPTILEIVPVTNRVEAFRQAEAQKKECDFLLETTFTQVQAKSTGGFLSKAKDAAKSINNETGAFKNSSTRIQDTNRKADSVANISSKLTPNPKDKVRVAYKLISMASKQPVLTQEKEVAASDLPSFLEKFANDVVTEALK